MNESLEEARYERRQALNVYKDHAKKNGFARLGATHRGETFRSYGATAFGVASAGYRHRAPNGAHATRFQISVAAPRLLRHYWECNPRLAEPRLGLS